MFMVPDFRCYLDIICIHPFNPHNNPMIQNNYYLLQHLYLTDEEVKTH